MSNYDREVIVKCESHVNRQMKGDAQMFTYNYKQINGINEKLFRFDA